MRAFEYHPLSKITVKEKFMGNWSLTESFWIVLGLYLSSKLAGLVPKLPLPSAIANEYFILQYLHYGIPFLICIVFGFVEHKSGLKLLPYFVSYRSYKRRKKKILDHKEGD